MKVATMFAVFLVVFTLVTELVYATGTRNKVLTLFASRQYPWNTASRLCKDNGMRLVKADNRDVLSALRLFARSDAHWKHVWNKDTSEFWTGLHKDEDSGDYVWHDCQSLGPLMFWEPGSNSGDRCVSGLPGLVDREFWSKTVCSKLLYTICEETKGHCSFLTYPYEAMSYPGTYFAIGKSLTDCQQKCLDFDQGLECWAVMYDNVPANQCTLYIASSFSEISENRVPLAMSILYVKFCFTEAITDKVVPLPPLEQDEKFPSDKCEPISQAEITSGTTVQTREPISQAQVTSGPTVQTDLYTPEQTTQSNTPKYTFVTDLFPSYMDATAKTTSKTDSVTSDQTSTQGQMTIYPKYVTNQLGTTSKGIGAYLILDDSTTAVADVGRTTEYPVKAPTSETATALPIHSVESLPSKQSTMVAMSTARSQATDVLHAETSLRKDLTPAQIQTVTTTTTLVTAESQIKGIGPPTSLDFESSNATTTTTTTEELCTCDCQQVVMETHEEDRFLATIIQGLYIDVTNISAYQRRFYSVPDLRPSAQTIGYLGVVMLCAAFTVLLIADVTTFMTAGQIEKPVK